MTCFVLVCTLYFHAKLAVSLKTGGIPWKKSNITGTGSCLIIENEGQLSCSVRFTRSILSTVWDSRLS